MWEAVEIAHAVVRPYTFISSPFFPMNKILKSAIFIIGITGVAFLIGIVQSSMTGTTFYDPAGLYP